MGDPYARRTALALLLLMAAWAVGLLLFSPTGWLIAAGLAFMAMVAAPPLP
jgi:uncharacterized membrane protein YhhN